MGHKVYIRSKKTKAGQPGIWSDKKRIEVLTTYLATGSPTLTCAMTGVPMPTFKHWKAQPWWQEQQRELLSENQLKLDNKLEKTMDKALDAVMDRIENGEFMYDPRTGEVRRVPAKLRDVQKVASDMIDKRQLLRKGNRTEEAAKNQVTADHLVQLANAFAQFAQGNPKHVPEEKTVTSVTEGDYELLEAVGLEPPNKKG